MHRVLGRFLVLDVASGVTHHVTPENMPPGEEIDGSRMPGRAVCGPLFWWTTDPKMSLPVTSTSFRAVLVLIKGAPVTCMACIAEDDA